MRTLCWLLTVVLWAVSALAQAPKIQKFGESDLNVIHTKIRFTTIVVLPEGEELSEVTCGHSEWWVVEGKDGIVHIKPSKEGAQTNLNIVTKNRAVYSFLLQEITRPGSKDKPDLRVMLGGDELTKLRKDKESVEELLSRTEGELRKAKEDIAAAKEKKKEEPPPAKADAPKADAVATSTSSLERLSAPPTTPDVAAPFASAPKKLEEERPLVTSYVIEPQEGLLTKGGRAFGRFFKRVARTLRLY